MKKILFIFVFALFFISCKVTKQTQLSFVSEFVLADSTQFQNTKIGGLSGIDFVNNSYFFVVDDAQNPRVLKAEIIIENDVIKNINFKKVILLKDNPSTFYDENILDLESIFVDEKTGEINLVSEGSINSNKLPTVFKIDENGAFLEAFSLPKNLTNLNTIKHNAAFEASSKSFDHKGFWVAMEAPLKTDGEDPNFTKQSSPIRISYIDNVSKKVTKQFAYQLENLTKPAKGNINLNGATAILEYKENHFFVVERIYQNNYGAYGNTIRIFEAILDKNSTNILQIDALKNTPFIALKKRLVLDFNLVKNKLTDGIIDNIEGISFGPKLMNGNSSLVLIADDNFQVYGKQLNQFILLEIKTK